MANLIDVEAAIERARKSDGIVGSSIWETSEVINFLEDEPTIDAVPVVRCKHCRYYNEDGEYCGLWGSCRHPEHFCGEGERKDNAM